MLAILSLQSTAFAGVTVLPNVQRATVNMPVVDMAARPAPFKKPVPKKAPVTKKAVVKRPVVKKTFVKKAPPKPVPKKKVAPPKKVSKSNFAYGLPGNFNPIGGGELNFDPYGFLEGKSALEVNRYRECELTHGRVGMLAAVGFIVQEKFHPLFSGVGGPAIDQIPQLPFAWYFSLGLGITFCEFYRIQIAFRELDQKTKEGVKMLKAETAIRPGYVPGQIGFDPLGFAPEDPAEFREMQTKELMHCRVAMIAAAGFLAQEAVTGQTWGTVLGAPDF